MAKYAVIGCLGFSGQDFVDLLLDDPARDVIGIGRSASKPDFMLRYRARVDQSRFRFHEFDLNRDMDALLAFLDAERPEFIVNFAAMSEVGPSWQRPEDWFRTNTVALARFVNHVSRQKYLKRYLHISSPEAYGNCTGTVTETARDNPSTPYAASKSAADMLLGVYHKQFGFPLVTVRATNVYGARQQLYKIICRSAIYLHQGRKIRLDGGGVAVKSFIHVRDVSRGELAILERGRVGERYHLSPDGGGIGVRDVVRMVCDKMGRSFEASTEIGPERPGQDAAYVIDSSKARSELGWRPAIDLDEGIAEAVDWVDRNWNAIAAAPHEYQHKA